MMQERSYTIAAAWPKCLSTGAASSHPNATHDCLIVATSEKVDQILGSNVLSANPNRNLAQGGLFLECKLQMSQFKFTHDNSF